MKLSSLLQILFLMDLLFVVTIKGHKKHISIDLDKPISTARQSISPSVGENGIQSQQEETPLTIKWARKRPRKERQPKGGFLTKESNTGENATQKNKKRKIKYTPRLTFVKPQVNKPLWGLANDGQCETHTPLCVHWNELSKEDRHKSSAKLSRRRKSKTPKGREEARRRADEYYTNLNETEKKQLNKSRWKREKELENQLTPEQYARKRLLKNRNARSYRIRKKMKGRQTLENSE